MIKGTIERVLLKDMMMMIKDRKMSRGAPNRNLAFSHEVLLACCSNRLVIYFFQIRIMKGEI